LLIRLFIAQNATAEIAFVLIVLPWR